MNSAGFNRKRSWLHFVYDLKFAQISFRNSKYLNKESRYPVRDLNPRPAECKARVTLVSEVNKRLTECVIFDTFYDAVSAGRSYRVEDDG